MKISRPYTAFKDSRVIKNESKAVLSRIKRPNSAKNDSLKKIIQVIQSTLNKGAQTILSKAKTLERFSKYKNQPDFSQFRMPKQRISYDRQIPHFRTEFTISSSSELQKSVSSVKSSKKIYPSYQNDQFIPYMKQISFKTENDQAPKKDKLTQPLKRMTKQRKHIVEKDKQKDNLKDRTLHSTNLIDKWENQVSIFNMSYLLDQQLH